MADESADKSVTTPLGGTVAPIYRERTVNYFNFSESDIRHINVANICTAIFAAIGTFALTAYFDFSKDLAIADDKAPELLVRVTSLLFWSWLVCWGLAAIAFLWLRNEIQRIKEEHGVLPPSKRLFNWMKDRVSR